MSIFRTLFGPPARDQLSRHLFWHAMSAVQGAEAGRRLVLTRSEVFAFLTADEATRIAEVGYGFALYTWSQRAIQLAGGRTSTDRQFADAYADAVAASVRDERTAVSSGLDVIFDVFRRFSEPLRTVSDGVDIAVLDREAQERFVAMAVPGESYITGKQEYVGDVLADVMDGRMLEVGQRVLYLSSLLLRRRAEYDGVVLIRA